MSSGSSTERGRPGRDSGYQLWHVYLILSMGGAIWVVVVSRHTHPAALLLISAAVLAAGLVGMALHYAFSGFFGGTDAGDGTPLPAHERGALEREKALVLRSIKELEFDRAMRKVSEADFAELSVRLRERAMVLMQDLERIDQPRPSSPKPKAESPEPICPSCGTAAEADARFCKECGARL
jgi:hypothetical protein